MELKLWINISILVLIERSIAVTTPNYKELIEVETNDGLNQCTTKLQSCKVSLPKGSLIGEKGALGDKGEKGSTGPPGTGGRDGAPGTTGYKGDKGEPGINGNRGVAGVSGPKGDTGLPGNDGLIGAPGQKGDKGDNGLPGIEGKIGAPGPSGDKGISGRDGKDGVAGAKGDKGEPGIRGSDGIVGAPGTKGDVGPKGEIGFPGSDGMNGPPGTNGLPGPKGEAGFPGSNGLTGEPGRKGDVGPRGFAGLPGTAGTPGVCSCTPYEVDDTGSEGIVVFGTDTNPANVTCKYGPEDLESGTYYFYRSEPFKAMCNMTSFTTCIVPERLSTENIEEKSIDYSKLTEPFWLSTQGMNIMDIYGLTLGHIHWLQKQSVMATMTLRYHCKNSILFSQSDRSKATKMLTWSELLIGPYPSETTPFYYSIDDSIDGCKDSDKYKSEWRHTDITLTSSIASRLPIQDFYIRDIRNEHQSVYIELISLCFG